MFILFVFKLILFLLMCLWFCVDVKGRMDLLFVRVKKLVFFLIRNFLISIFFLVLLKVFVNIFLIVVLVFLCVLVMIIFLLSVNLFVLMINGGLSLLR